MCRRVVPALVCTLALLAPAATAPAQRVIRNGLSDHAKGTDRHRPHLLGIRYRKARPEGGDRAYWGLWLRTRVADGRVVRVVVQQLRPSGSVVELDGGCRRGAREGSGANTWVDARYLNPGRYRFRITLNATTCRPGDPHPEARTFLRTIRVRAS